MTIKSETKAYVKHQPQPDRKNVANEKEREEEAGREAKKQKHEPDRHLRAGPLSILPSPIDS